MARTAKNKIDTKTEAIRHKCRECINSKDWFSKAHDGSLILGYCKFKKEGRYAILLDDYACTNFIQR